MSDGIAGSVGVEVVPDASGWNAKVRSQVVPGADAVGREYGDALSAGIREGLHDPDITPHVRDEEARAEIDALKLKIDELSHEHADIDVTVNNASGVRSWLTSLVAGAVAVAPAFVVAAGGVAAFTALAIPSLSKVVEYEQQVGKNALQARLDWAGLTAEQKQMAQGIDGLRSEFAGLQHDIQPEVLDVFNAALAQVDKILPEIVPLAIAGGKALSGLITQVGNAFTGSDGQQFFEFVAKNLPQDVEEIGSTVSALIHTFFSLVEALQPVSVGLLHVVSAGADFLSWLSRTAPWLTDVTVLAVALYKPLKVLEGLEVASTFKNLASALQGVAVASDAKGLRFAWLANLTSAPGRLKEFASAAIDAAGAQKILDGAAAESGAGFRVFAVDAAGAAEEMAELSRTEKALAITTAALDAVNPLVWVAAAAAVIGGTYVVASKLATDSINDQVAALQKQDHATGLNVAGYQKLTQQLHALQVQTHEVNSAATTGLGDTNPISQLWKDITDSKSDAAFHLAQGQLHNLTGAISEIHDKVGLTTPQIARLAAQLGISDKAFTSSAKSAQDAAQQIIAYASAGAQIPQVSANMQVVSFAAEQQKSFVTALASAWQTYVSSLTGTQSSFDSFGQSMATLDKDAKAAGASFGGLNQKSLALNSQFQSQVNSLQAVSTTLRESGASAKVFDSGIAGGIATLIPFAQHSKIARQELLAVAAQADHGVTSFRGLEKWAGSSATGMKRLQDASDKATIAEAKVSQASKQLGAALQSDVSSMMAVAALRTSGAQQAIDRYAQSLQKTGADSTQSKNLQQDLIATLEKAGLKASQAKQEADALAKAYGGEGAAAQGAAGKMDDMTRAASRTARELSTVATNAYLAQQKLDAMHGKTIDISVNYLVGGSKAPQWRPTPTGFAAGGVQPGRDTGRDEYLVAVRGGEGFLVPSAVHALGGAAGIDAINRRFGGGGGNKPGHYANGGIAAQATFGFPNDTFDITINPILNLGGGAGGPVNGTPLLGNLYGLLRGELKSGASASSMHQDSKELAKAFSDAYRDTASQIRDETKTALSDIRQYYSGPAATQLESTIRTQGDALAKLATASDNLASKIADMRAYAQQETQSLQSFSDLSTITGGTDENGNPLPVTGQDIQTSLQQDLATLKKFDSVIKQLKAKGVSKVLIAQVIALGPADGVTYGEAILAGGKDLISELNKDEKAIQSIDVKIGQHAADVQFGQPLAKSFLSELDKEKAKLEQRMKHLGSEIAKELERALGSIKIKAKGAGASASVAGISADALGSAISVGGTAGISPPHVITKSDVASIRTDLQIIATRETTLITKMTELVTLAKANPKATGQATGAALASELNGIAKNAAAAARARTR